MSNSDDKRLNIESNKLTSIDILKHKVVIKFCMVTGKSPVETRRSLDAAEDGPKVSRTMVYARHLRLKDGRTDICDDE